MKSTVGVEQTEMKDDRKDRLVELGAESVAEALLELESRNDAARDVVARMLATSQENVKRFKSKLLRLKRSERFVSWRESADLAHRLEGLLDDLRAGVEDPRTGIELLVSFYESDEAIKLKDATTPEGVSVTRSGFKPKICSSLTHPVAKTRNGSGSSSCVSPVKINTACETC